MSSQSSVELLTQNRWGVIDDRSIAEARELVGLRLRRDRMQWNTSATRDAIRQFTVAVDRNPLWTDVEHAESSRWGALLAPPSFLYAVDAAIIAPKMPGVQWIYAGTRFRWYDVIRVDDTFVVDVVFTEMEEKAGRKFGLWLLQKGEIVYRRDDGGLICVAEGRVARTPRQSKSREVPKSSTKNRASHLPQERMVRYEPTHPEPMRRGTELRMWESVRLKDVIGPMAQLLTLNRIFHWYTGAQGALHYGGAHGDAVRYRSRHDDYEINHKTGAKDSAARGHFSSMEAKDVGMDGAYDVGLHRIAWVTALLTDWMGDDGHLAEVDVDIVRPNIIGDTTYFSGVVTDLWIDGNSFVGVKLEGRNQANVVNTRGRAIVSLPSEERGPVLLPLFDADLDRWTSSPESVASDS